MDKGYVQIYTGNGKGKTTCAMGLALRACCFGMKVLFLQFIKSGSYSETHSEAFVPGLRWEQYGEGRFIRGNPSEEDMALARQGVERLRDAVTGGEWDVVVADEACVAQSMGLIDAEEILQILRDKAEKTEVILTGRNAPQAWIDFADLVTEMREIKHYYNAGVKARKGIEC